MPVITDLKVQIVKNSIFTDITDGILNVESIRGTEVYQSAAQIFDIGQLTITSRNKNIDPHINPDIRFNAEIWVSYQDEILFRGYITDVNVEYGAFNEDTIITINATDPIGLIQRHRFSQDFSDYVRTNYPNGINIIELCNELNGYYNYNTGKTEIENFYIQTDWAMIRGEQSQLSCPIAKTAIKPNDPALDVITALLQSSLFTLAQRNFGAYIYPYTKYDSYFYNFNYTEYLNTLPVSFASDGSAIPYKSILVDDGFQRTSNLIDISNSSVEFGTGSTFVENSSSYGPYILQESATDWGSNQLTMGTVFSGTEDTQTTYDDLARDLLEVDGVPELNIAQITVDAGKYWEEYNPIYYINSIFGTLDVSDYKIKHDINDSLSIEKVYTVVGVRYSIDYNNFYATYTLKESQAYLLREKQIQQPQVVINGTLDPSGEWYNGDTNFNWVASITGFPTGQIAQVDWDLDAFYIDGPEIINDPTATWNYDPPLVDPEDWQGPGFKKVRAVITTIDGWRVYSNEVLLNITGAVPHADFVYTSNSYGGYTFTDTSFDADTWLWDFDDGTTSTLQNPPTKYWTASDTYNVSLTISNGVNTDTKTIPVTISNTLIPVKYVKARFSGTRTRATSGSPWNKTFITSLSKFDIRTPSADRFHPVTYTATKGTVKLPSGSPLPSPTIVLNDNGAASQQRAYIAPLVTNSGNTEEIDISFIMDFSSNMSTGGTITHYADWDSYVNKRFKLQDFYLTFYSGIPNQQPEPVDITVSPDGTNWYSIGRWKPTSLPTVGWYTTTLVDTPPQMPPIFPT